MESLGPSAVEGLELLHPGGGPFDRCGAEPVVDHCIAHVVATFVWCWRVELAELSTSLQCAGFVGLSRERGSDRSLRVPYVRALIGAVLVGSNAGSVSPALYTMSN